MSLMDLSDKKSPFVVDGIENKKCCSDCNTTRTPLWRGGPAGPKSLCNACGIRYRKKRRAILDMNKASKKKAKGGGSQSNSPINTTSSSSSSSSNSVLASNYTAVSHSTSENSNGLSESFTMRLMALGDEVFLTPLIVKKQRCQRRRKLKEEEEAAFSLIALSCGSVSVLA